MQRVHVVTYVNFATRENQVVGVYDELSAAMDAAEKFYLKVCGEQGVEPEPHSPCTYTITHSNGIVQAFVEVNNLTLQSEYFPITSLSRSDLEWKGYDLSNVDDDEIERIANKMGNAYLDNGYWEDLVAIADFENIPRKED